MNLVLWEHNGHWTANFDGKLQPCVGAESPATLIDALRQMAGARRISKVLLALSSRQVLFFRFPKPAGRADRQSLVFEFETALPIAAEEFECDFQSQGDRVAGLAVAHSGLVPWLQALEDAEFPVYSITAAGLLAVQHWRQNQTESSGILIWQHEQELQLFRFAGKHIVDWRTVSADPVHEGVLQLELAALLLNSDSSDTSNSAQTASFLNVTPSVRERCESTVQKTQTVSAQPFDAAVVAAGTTVLAGKADPWFELRRGALVVGSPLRPVESALRILLLMACVLLAVLSVACWQRGRAYAKQVARLQKAQQDAFVDVFPKEDPPRDILARLEDEARILGGGNRQAAAKPRSASALLRLNEFMARLPQDPIRLETDLLKVTDSGIELTGTIPTSQLANQLVSALREDGHFAVRENLQKTDTGNWSVNLVLQANSEAE